MNRVRGFTKRAPRIDLRRPAIMIDSDDREAVVTILDVSSGGFRLEARETPRIGEFVRLRVEHGDEFQAQIRWALGTEAGGVFLTPVAYDELGAERMAEKGHESDDRRVGEDRRSSDRREGGDRRQSPHEGDRRQGDRRQGDRRS